MEILSPAPSNIDTKKKDAKPKLATETPIRPGSRNGRSCYDYYCGKKIVGRAIASPKIPSDHQSSHVTVVHGRRRRRESPNGAFIGDGQETTLQQQLLLKNATISRSSNLGPRSQGGKKVKYERSPKQNRSRINKKTIHRTFGRAQASQEFGDPRPKVTSPPN